MLMPQLQPYSFLSFFSGALGLDLGLEAAGLYPLAVNDVDRHVCETIRLNRPDLRLYNCDIRELTAERLMSDLSVKPKELFLIAGGPPCQAFSTAGKRRGLNDERGNVFLHLIDLVGTLEPKYVLIENVRGLLSVPLQHRPHSNRGGGSQPLSPNEKPGGALRHILLKLKEYGYEMSFNLYNTANFGVPQTRERVVLLGSRDGHSIPHLMPTHDEHGRHGLPKWETFRQATAHIGGKQDYLAFPERRLHYYRMLKPGQNWRNLPEGIKPEAMGKSYFAGGGKTGFYRRLAWDRPSPTLVTCPTMPATDLAHPVEDRPLSVQEYSVLQTFPEGWEFAGSMSDKYRQIGNAVPVRFGARVGLHLIGYDAGTLNQHRDLIPPSRYRNTDDQSWWRSVSNESEKGK